MQKSSNQKPRIKWIRYLLIAIIAYTAFHWLSGPTGLISQWNLKKRNIVLQKEMDSLTNLLQKLEKERQRLQTDTSYIEQVIRQELGMSKENEKVYKFVQNKP